MTYNTRHVAEQKHVHVEAGESLLICLFKGCKVTCSDLPNIKRCLQPAHTLNGSQREKKKKKKNPRWI